MVLTKNIDGEVVEMTAAETKDFTDKQKLVLSQYAESVDNYNMRIRLVEIDAKTMAALRRGESVLELEKEYQEIIATLNSAQGE